MVAVEIGQASVRLCWDFDTDTPTLEFGCHVEQSAYSKTASLGALASAARRLAQALEIEMQTAYTMQLAEARVAAARCEKRCGRLTNHNSHDWTGHDPSPDGPGAYWCTGTLQTEGGYEGDPG